MNVTNEQVIATLTAALPGSTAWAPAGGDTALRYRAQVPERDAIGLAVVDPLTGEFLAEMVTNELATDAAVDVVALLFGKLERRLFHPSMPEGWTPK